MRFKNPQTVARRGRRRHRARRPVPADPGRRRPGAVPGDRPALLEPRPRRARARPRLRRRAHRRASTTYARARRARSTGTPCWRATGLRPRRRSSALAGDVRGVRAHRSSAGRWASPSTATRSRRSRRSSTCCCCAATSASRAPGCARCAATPTCRATARWASGRSRPTTFLDALGAGVRLRPAARARLRHRRRDPGDARRPGARCSSGMGGNFVSRHPRHRRSPRRRCARCALTVQVSTKLNRSHVRAPGEPALILPCLGRTERDVQAAGEQFVTVEDSMSMVHASRGRLEPGVATSCAARSAIVCRLAAALLGPTTRSPWDGVRRRLRPRSATRSRASCPASTTTTTRVRAARRVRAAAPAARPRDVPHRRRARPSSPSTRSTSLAGARRAGCCCRRVRSHDQYNTTIYGLDDRYRGIQRRPPGGVRATRTTSPRSASPTATWSTSCREWTRRRRARRAERFRVVAVPDRARAAPRPTSRRPTCWCRSTASPTAATRPTSKADRGPPGAGRLTDRPAAPLFTGVCTTTAGSPASARRHAAVRTEFACKRR